MFIFDPRFRWVILGLLLRCCPELEFLGIYDHMSLYSLFPVLLSVALILMGSRKNQRIEKDLAPEIFAGCHDVRPLMDTIFWRLSLDNIETSFLITFISIASE